VHLWCAGMKSARKASSARRAPDRAWISRYAKRRRRSSAPITTGAGAAEEEEEEEGEESAAAAACCRAACACFAWSTHAQMALATLTTHCNLSIGELRADRERKASTE